MQGKEQRSTAHAMRIADSFKNLVVGTEKGNIKTYGYPLIGQNFDQFSAHYGEVTQICISPNGEQVITAGHDGSIFIFSITEYENEFEPLKQGSEEEKDDKTQYKSMIVAEELSDIVLIERQEMEEWTKKQEQLRCEMEEAQHKLESSVTEVKNKF